MTRVKAYQNEFRPKLIKHIINQISKGETVALIGFPGVGKTNTIHWIEKRTLSDYKNILLIHIDFNNLVSTKDLAFYRLILLELHNSIKTLVTDKNLIKILEDIYEQNINSNDALLTFAAIKRVLKEVLSKTDYIVCMLFNDFEKTEKMSGSIFNSILALRSLDKTRIVYLFVITKCTDEIFYPNKIGELYNLLNYNKHWLRLLNKGESIKLAEEFALLLGHKLDKKAKERIWELSGGHAWYIKVLTKLFCEKEITSKTPVEVISKLSSIKARASQLWESSSDKHKEILQKLALTRKAIKQEISEHLTATGIVKIDKGKTKFFSPLFELFVKEYAEVNGYKKYPLTEDSKDIKQGLTFDLKKRVVSKNGKSLDKSFTRNEFNLLKYLFENQNLVLTRDEIAEVLWGKDASEKYSEWAIDKVISRIREKIEETSRKPKYLITLRGVGFKFHNLPE